ncbi:hypothetical protein GCM10020000_79940 [Streptomyces olivoverticillatus]
MTCALAGLGARLPERLYVAASPAPQENSDWARRWASLSEDALLGEVVALGGVPPQVLDHPRLGRRITQILGSDVAWLARQTGRCSRSAAGTDPRPGWGP